MLYSAVTAAEFQLQFPRLHLTVVAVPVGSVMYGMGDIELPPLGLSRTLFLVGGVTVVPRPCTTLVGRGMGSVGSEHSTPSEALQVDPSFVSRGFGMLTIIFSLSFQGPTEAI